MSVAQHSRPDTHHARTFLLHVHPLEPADDDDKDGTVLSAREPRRSRSAAVALPEPETSTAGEPSEKPLSERSLEHRDERQVGLDTDRSFVLYPVGKANIPRLTSAGQVLNVRSLQRRRRRRIG